LSSLPQLLVSTHFDDVALSLAHVLGPAGPRATVVTVCGGVPPRGEPASEWDARAGFASGWEAARTRAREDREACRVTGARALPLPHPDSPYGPLPEAAVLRAEIEPLLQGGCVLWLPAGIVNEDHAHVRDALLPLTETLPARRVRIYADLPYAALEGWDLPEAVSLARPGLRVQDVQLRAAAFEGKLAAVRCHASQVPLLSVGAENLLAPDGLLARERFWALADSAAGVILQE
jgi:LmbE family N-acetylglucosaminyl deacetylase